jgi:hypothetical protein
MNLVQTGLRVLDDIEISIINYILSYRDILNRSPLPFFVGGDMINKHVDKLEKEKVLRNMNASLEAGEETLLKGVVREG